MLKNNNPDLNRFRILARNWEVLGDTDPMFGILSDPSKHGGKWDAETFFASGRVHVQSLLRLVNSARASFYPGSCLDFGCGVGRLTAPLSESFQRTIGVDVAAPMIERARQLQRPGSRCEFVVNRDPDLRRFADGSFDFVHSCLVLQHIPPAISVTYIAEFFRIAKPGGVVVFQLPAETRTAEEVAASQALPPSAYAAELAFVSEPFTLAASDVATVTVRVTNRGDVTWPHDIPGGRQIGIGNHWLREDNTRVVDDDGRALLPYSLVPGAVADISLRVQAPDAPGRYILEVDAVHEHVCWFNAHSSQTARQSVTVDAARVRTDGEQPSAAAVPVSSDVPVSDAPRGSGFMRLLRRLRGGTPTFEMHVVARTEVERVIRENGGELVRAVDDNAAGAGWVSYTYVCRRRQDYS